MKKLAITGVNRMFEACGNYQWAREFLKNALEAGATKVEIRYWLASERQVAVDVPRFTYVSKDDFENPWHLASWDPLDPQGPTVLMNRDCPILLEAIKYHQGQYPDVYAPDVEDIVKNTYGEVAVCKVAHSQKLAKHVPEEDLDEVYRSEAALTVGLMGLLAEESLIAQRLGKLGRKKAAA